MADSVVFHSRPPKEFKKLHGLGVFEKENWSGHDETHLCCRTLPATGKVQGAVCAERLKASCQSLMLRGTHEFSVNTARVSAAHSMVRANGSEGHRSASLRGNSAIPSSDCIGLHKRRLSGVPLFTGINTQADPRT